MVTKRPFWVWVCVVYMTASVAYNCWNLLPGFRYLSAGDQAPLAFNLLCNFGGVIALFFLSRWAIYLLALGFVDGALATAWPIFEAYRHGAPLHIPISVLSFSWPFAMIIYAIWLARRGVLR